MAARLYAGLYGYSGKIQDKEEALDYYNRLLKRFPKSPYRSKANRAIAKLSRDDGKEMVQEKIAVKQASVRKGVLKSKTPLQVKKAS